MKKIFSIGDIKKHEKLVERADFAAFETGVVHQVCSTFSLAQAVEYAGRLFALDIKEEDEEGIGTMLTIFHKAPAFEGETISIEARLTSQEKNEIICSFEAKVGDRLVAVGETGQKILKKEKLRELLNKPQ